MHPKKTDLDRRYSTILDNSITQIIEDCASNQTDVNGDTVDAIVSLTPPILSQSTAGEYDDDINV